MRFSRSSVVRVMRMIAVLPVLLRDPTKTKKSPCGASVAKRHVCIITKATGFGGMEVHTLALIKKLLAQGYRITLIVSGDNPYDDKMAASGMPNNINVIHTDLGLQNDSGITLNKWKELFTTFDRDVLILVMAGNNTGTVNFLLLCRASFRRVFFIDHLEAAPAWPSIPNLSYGRIPGLFIRWCRNRLVQRLRYSCADRIIAVSDAVGSRLVRDWGYPPDRVSVIKNGVSWRNYVRSEDKGEAFRRQYGVPRDAFVFGMVTRLYEVKGIDIALQALHLLHQRPVDKVVRLVVAGTGPQAENLQQLANELGLQDQVIFTGFVANPGAILSGFDSILFASRREGLPLALLEAMAAGCIPIVTRIAGMPEAVNSPEIGWVVAPESPEELCAAMRDVIVLDRPSLSQMRQNAVRRIRDAFDLDQSNRRILEVCGL